MSRFGLGLIGDRTFVETTIYSKTLTTNSTGEENYSRRGLAVITGGGIQVRVRFTGNSAATWNVDNCSIGIMATAPSTLATPVELKFSGASGFSLAAGASLFSDWTPLVFSASDKLVVILDNSATNGNFRFSASGGDDTYYKAATDSFNQASVSGFTVQSGVFAGFDRIEARN